MGRRRRAVVRRQESSAALVLREPCAHRRARGGRRNRGWLSRDAAARAPRRRTVIIRGSSLSPSSAPCLRSRAFGRGRRLPSNPVVFGVARERLRGGREAATRSRPVPRGAAGRKSGPRGPTAARYVGQDVGHAPGPAFAAGPPLHPEGAAGPVVARLVLVVVLVRRHGPLRRACAVDGRRPRSFCALRARTAQRGGGRAEYVPVAGVVRVGGSRQRRRRPSSACGQAPRSAASAPVGAARLEAHAISWRRARIGGGASQRGRPRPKALASTTPAAHVEAQLRRRRGSR